MSDSENLNICNQIEIHALDYEDNFRQVVPIAIEHGFQAIATSQGRVSALNKIINEFVSSECNRPEIIAVIDHPFGCESIDTRAYQIHSAKEQGAEIIEMVALYRALAEGDLREVTRDLDNLGNIAAKCDVDLRYVIEPDSFVSISHRNFLAKEIAIRDTKIISTSLGFYDEKVSVSDRVLWLRDIKKLSGCQMKSYVYEEDIDMVSTLIKAGAEIIGLDWQSAPRLAYEYEELIRSHQSQQEQED